MPDPECGLAALERQAREDLDTLAYPDRNWVQPLAHRSGQHVYDVVIVGAGQARLAAGFMLKRDGVTNVLLVDRNVNLVEEGIDVAVRTQSDAEVAYLESQGVGLAIMGTRELSFGLADYALRSLGVSKKRAAAIIQKERISGEGGAFERRPDLPDREAPELRLRRQDDEEAA